jgi:hypothetical protein
LAPAIARIKGCDLYASIAARALLGFQEEGCLADSTVGLPPGFLTAVLDRTFSGRGAIFDAVREPKVPRV